MKYYLKGNDILNEKINLRIKDDIYAELSIEDLKVVGKENLKFNRFIPGDKLLNYIFSFEYEDMAIIRVYSTYTESDAKKFFNIIINKEDKVLIEGVINILKTDTWTIENNGSIKYGNNEYQDGDALSNIFNYFEITKKLDYERYICDTTIEEKQLLDILHDKLMFLE